MPDKPKPPKIALDRTAWERGVEAGRQPLPPECPYPAKSTESLSWSSGFIEGEAERHNPTPPRTGPKPTR